MISSEPGKGSPNQHVSGGQGGIERHAATGPLAGIGICERLACSRIAAVLSAWRRASPEVDLQIVSRSGRALLSEIEGGLLDADITAMQVTEPGIAGEKLWTDPWVIALVQDHALTSARAIELAEIACEPLALFSPAPDDTFERRLLDHVPGTDPPLFIAERPSSAPALMTWRRPTHGITGERRRALKCDPPATSPRISERRDSPPPPKVCAKNTASCRRGADVKDA